MEIVFFDKKIAQFIEGLDHSTHAKVLHAFDLLERFGATLRMPHSKSLGDSLFVLRIRGRIDVRLIYVYKTESAYILHAFIKKSMKPPLKELWIAQQRLGALDRV